MKGECAVWIEGKPESFLVLSTHMSASIMTLPENQDVDVETSSHWIHGHKPV